MDTTQPLLPAVDGTVYHGVPADVKVADLVDESITAFSDAPFEFEPAASMLWEDTKRNYYHACKANRFSEDYLKLCGQLEKNITQMGKFCLTKAVLETKGMEFPGLADLSILELVKMVSFHLRKTHAAFEGIYWDNNFFGTTYLNWEFRWFGLGNKLNVTEAKIRKIKEGKINVEKLLAEAEPFKDIKNEKLSKDEDNLGETRALRANSNALPLDKTMARQMLGWEKDEEKDRERIRRQKEKTEKLADRFGDMSKRNPNDNGWYQMLDLEKEQVDMIRKIKSPNLKEKLLDMYKEPEEDPKPGRISTPEIRRRLLELAKERRDEQALDEIPTEDEESLFHRWEHHLEYDRHPGSALSAHEVREKLLKDAERRNDTEALRLIPNEDQFELLERWNAYLARTERSHPSTAGPPASTRKALRDKRKKKKK